ncbi:MAG: lipopolysaccharide heptosyltransferase family protein [Rhodospirillales bacterium]|nr:lipopolysaccharide heptosyltransferase family protein [Rhodospirillales bacterium]
MHRVGVYVGLDLVGDGLIKLPFVRALRRAFPEAELIWIAGEGRSAYAGALAPLMPGLLDRVVERSGTGAGLRRALGPRLDLLIDTQTHVGTTLALRLLRPRRFVTAAAGYWLSDRRPRALRPRRVVERLLLLLELATGREPDASGAVELPASAKAQAAALLPGEVRRVALVLGAGGRHKAWPLGRHIELARALVVRGIEPVAIAGPAEADLVGAFREAVPEAAMPLQQIPPAGPELTIALAARCAAGVAGDCGGGHMLAAADIALVSLFGPTDPAKFAPWCAHSTIVRAQDHGGPDMAAIPLAAVLAALTPFV